MTTPKLPLGMTKTPLGWPELASEYLDFARWASHETDYLKRFCLYHALHSYLPRDLIEFELRREKQNFDIKFMTEFLDWLTVNHWGE